MRRISILTISTLLALSCSKESPTGSGSGSIQGHVYQLNTTTPVSGVVITAAGISATTGTDGKYAVSGVPAGRVTVLAAKSDYEAYQNTVDLGAGQLLSLDIYLTASVSGTNLSGTIRDHDSGMPITGAKVELGGQVDYSDASGHYQLANIPQGSQMLVVEKTGYIMFSGQVFLSSSNKVFDVDLTKGSIIANGHITKDTTLSFSASPYYVKDNILIETGVTLNIEPGVTMKFDDGKALVENSNDANYTQGVLVAAGTSSRPIVFTSSSSVTTQGSWQGITIAQASQDAYGGSSNINTLSYCKVMYASCGLNVQVYGTRPAGMWWWQLQITNLIVENCSTGIQGPILLTNGILTSNGIGAALTSGLIYAQISLKNVLVSHNGSGINITGQGAYVNLVMSNCTVDGNQGDGVVVLGARGILPERLTTIVQNCIIKNNQGIGLKYSGDFAYFQNIDFVANSKLAFDRYSLWFITTGPPYIGGNYIAGNNGYSLQQIDTTSDGTGGQYKTNFSSTGSASIGNARTSPNVGAGYSWIGF